MLELAIILTEIQNLTGANWRFEIYYNDHFTYRLYCPEPKIMETKQELQGQWLDDLIENQPPQGDIDRGRIIAELERRI